MAKEAQEKETQSEVDKGINLAKTGDLMRQLFNVMPIEVKVSALVGIVSTAAIDFVGNTDEDWAPIIKQSRCGCGDPACACHTAQEIVIDTLYVLAKMIRKLGVPS